ncbi:MAG TPA: hypothetical protein VH765_00605, partial [Xanthobacteraceae bacterium]
MTLVEYAPRMLPALAAREPAMKQAFQIALASAFFAAAWGDPAVAQPKAADPETRAREVRVGRIMLENLYGDAVAALSGNQCEKFEKLRTQLSWYSASPNLVGQATGARPGELTQDDLVELSDYAGLLRQHLSTDCPKTASSPEPPPIQTVRSSNPGGSQDTGASSRGASRPFLPPSQSDGVFFVTGIDKAGSWISGDFGRTRHYIATNKTTFDNPQIDDDELPPPYIRCQKQRCEVVKPDSKSALTTKSAAKPDDNSKQTKTAVAPEASKTGIERAVKGGSTKGPDAPAKKTSEVKKSGESKEVSIADPDTGGGHTALAIAWLFLDEKPETVMGRIDPPNLKVDGPTVTIEQGQDRMKVVDAAQVLIRDAYTAALDGVMSEAFAIYVIRHAISDAGIALVGAQTVGKAVELSPLQLAALKNFGAIRIKDLQLTTPGNSQVGGDTKKDTKQPAASAAAAPART